MAKVLTKEQKEMIEKYYPIRSPEEVAEMTGMKKQNIIAYAYRHKISNNRYWTKEEEEYLENKYGIMTLSGIAKKLGRSKRSITDKIQKMKIGRFVDNADGICLAEVSRLVGRDKETIKKTWVKYGLKIYKKGRFSIIREKDLIDFMKENPDRWDATECETFFFERYEWFKKKRKKDLDAMCKRRWNVSKNDCRAY